MSAILARLEGAIERLFGWSRPVSITIAGEPFMIDSACALRGELTDYDYAWLRALAPGKLCVLDVGSNVTLTALLVARHMDPSGRCVLVDLSGDNLLLAARNLRRAGLLPKAAFVRMRVGDEAHHSAGLIARNVKELQGQ